MISLPTVIPFCLCCNMSTERNIRVLRQNENTVHSMTDNAEILHNGILSEALRIWKNNPSEYSPKDIYSDIVSGNLCTVDFARFCYRCTKETEEQGLLESLLPESVFVDDEIRDACIAYQRNMYTDRAFDVFAKSKTNASARHLPSLASVCEEVYYGRCGYCLLPIYSSQDGILTAFTRMITKYDLKIDTTCDVSIQEGDAILRFALLRRGLSTTACDPCYVQINAVLPETVQIGALLSSCETLHAEITELVTMPLSYTNDTISYTVRFRIASDALLALLLFLQATLDNYSLEGIFTMIHDK